MVKMEYKSLFSIIAVIAALAVVVSTSIPSVAAINPTNHIIEEPIRSGEDDGFVTSLLSQGNLINDSSSISIGQQAEDVFSLKFSAYLRFSNITLPTDAKISKAYITVVPTFTNRTGPIMNISAANHPNPTAPKNYSDYSTRNKTEASVDWNASYWYEGVSVNSPDISGIIQELVDSYNYNYSAGASILIFLDDIDKEIRTKYQAFAAYEHLGYEPAKLHIEYITIEKEQPPFASFTYSPEKPVVDQTVTFDASSSNDPDGYLTNYEWNFGDGTNGTGVVVDHSYKIPREYNVTLTVIDNDSLTNSTAKEITIGKISEVVFEDNFGELNLNTWIPFGTPSPRVLASAEGRGGVFDNNGDGWCNSGVVSKDNFSFPNGCTIESDIYLDVTNVAGCWNSPVIGLTRQSKPTGEGVCPTEDYPMGVIFGIEYDGDACWGTPEEKRRHAYFNIGLYTEDGTWESVSWLNADDYTDAWHNFKIAVGSDRIVKFYVDNDLIYTSKKRINETVLQEKKIFLGIRSSGSAGKSYHDYVKVYTLRKGEQKTVDIPIRSGKDDGYFMTFVSDSINDTSDLLIGQVAADIFSLKFSAFMRFPNVAIPKDAKITEAYITVVSTFTNQSGPLMKITANDQSNPTVPKDYSDYSTRIKTETSVNWNASYWNEGVSVNSPDISSVIQELVDSYDYSTGVPILIFLDDVDTEMRTKYQAFAAYEHPDYESTKLHIEYTTGGESESPLKMTITSDKEEYSPGDNVTITAMSHFHATPEEPIIITNPISNTFTMDGKLIFKDIWPISVNNTCTGETYLKFDWEQTIPDDAPEGYYDVRVSISGGKYVKTAEDLFYVKAESQIPSGGGIGISIKPKEVEVERGSTVTYSIMIYNYSNRDEYIDVEVIPRSCKKGWFSWVNQKHIYIKEDATTEIPLSVTPTEVGNFKFGVKANIERDPNMYASQEGNINVVGTPTR